MTIPAATRLMQGPESEAAVLELGSNEENQPAFAE